MFRWQFCAYSDNGCPRPSTVTATCWWWIGASIMWELLQLPIAQIRLTSWFLWSRAIARIGHHHSSWHPIIETSLQEPCEGKNVWPLGRWKVIEGWHPAARRMDKIDDFLSTIFVFPLKTNVIMTQVYRFFWIDMTKMKYCGRVEGAE